jgi:SHS2 domain-containing protein
MDSKPETRNPKLKYTVFDHTADLGLEIYGADAADLFANAVRAVVEMMIGSATVDTVETRHFAVEGSDWEDLLVNFLREILFMFNGEGFVPGECVISEIDDRHAAGHVAGEPFNPAKHQVSMEIKAVTYHRIAVRRTGRGWQGRVIFDV